jgi:hypothetical protein
MGYEFWMKQPITGIAGFAIDMMYQTHKKKSDCSQRNSLGVFYFKIFLVSDALI